MTLLTHRLLIKLTTCLNHHRWLATTAIIVEGHAVLGKLIFHATNTLFQKDAVSMAKESTSGREKIKSGGSYHNMSATLNYFCMEKKQCSFTIACTNLIMY